MTYLKQLNKELKKAKTAKPLTVNTFNLAGYEITLKTYMADCGKKTRLGSCTINGGKFVTQNELKQLIKDADE